MKILVTGGAGYIGSHTCVELLNAGYDVVVMDNLYNASEKAIERVEQITGKKVTFYKTDMLDREGVKKIFDNEKIDAVIHFAGLKAVGESVHKPIEYYHNFLHSIVVYHVQEFAIVKILGSNSPKGIVQKSHHHQADEEADQDNEYRLSVFRSSPGAFFWFPVLIFSIVHAFPPCMSNRPSFLRTL